MASVPQTHQRTCPPQESDRRTSTASLLPAAPESSGAARGRARQSLPAVDPSIAFGCVDWFLYPDAPPKAGAQAYQRSEI